MRLLQYKSDRSINFTEFSDNDSTPPYAILSHTWGTDHEEVTFEDLKSNAGTNKPGYEKIKFCQQQAKQDGLEFFWIDTCCIDKANKAELSHAIKSMFAWYNNATRCYVYMSDVSCPLVSNNSSFPLWESKFRRSRWFTRGWTLQELLAPRIVEFFSREGKRLGDKSSLIQQIHEITGIRAQALQGAPLSQFSINERLSWNEHRHTKLEEDRAYSLIGIFNVYISPFYGEGVDGAFKRLMGEIEKLGRCIQELRLTDPSDDKKRIEATKGSLLKDAYLWILENSAFRQWRDGDVHSPLLWIKGDPGKGKTMLLCGIVNELEKSKESDALLSYFYCQATDSHINNATAVLRGLLYMLVRQKSSLMTYLMNKYDDAGRSMFEDSNAWITLSETFTRMIQDPALTTCYLVVDGLDECIAGLPKLLDLIVSTSTLSTCVKWLLSSRNEIGIEQKFKAINSKSRLSLELKENAYQVSCAVNAYIDHKISFIQSVMEDSSLKEQLRTILRQKAHGTFLWVALMMQELERPESWDPLQVIEDAPSGLHELYHHMASKIQQLPRRTSEICLLLLSTATVAFRPLSLYELKSLCGLTGNIENTRKIIAMCGSFLTIRENQVYLVHQSAKDYLADKEQEAVFGRPGGHHHNIFSQSLKLMNSTLKRDIYGLIHPGYLITDVTTPTPDPLAATRYSCVYWVDHLCESGIDIQKGKETALLNNNAVHQFLNEHYLHWLEALSLCQSMTTGVTSTAKLEALTQGRLEALDVAEFVKDAHRFIAYHKGMIEMYPLQVYASALLFSPTLSQVRQIFATEEPRWATIKSAIGAFWGACQQTLEGHDGSITYVVFSDDSRRLATVSWGKTVAVRFWDVSSGALLQTFERERKGLTSLAFSPPLTCLAGATSENLVKVWDLESSSCLHTFEGHDDLIQAMAFSLDSKQLASASYDKTVRFWDMDSGSCLRKIHISYSFTAASFSQDLTRIAVLSQNTIWIYDLISGVSLPTLHGHRRTVRAVSFSYDSRRLASASNDCIVKLWDTSSGVCLHSLKGHRDWVCSVAFTRDSARIASSSFDNAVKIWDTNSGECLHTFEGHTDSVCAVCFSNDSTRLASASADRTVKIWNPNSDIRMGISKAHRNEVRSVVFSPESMHLASASLDHTVKIWDVSDGSCLNTIECQKKEVHKVAFSHDSTRLVTVFVDSKTFKIWDLASGTCLRAIDGHRDWVRSVVFSHDSALVASGSFDRTIKLWHLSNGTCLQTFYGHLAGVNAVIFSHDSTQLASTSNDKTVKVWNIGRGECLRTFGDHKGFVRSVVFSRDSKRVASSCYDEVVKLWDISSGTCLQSFAMGARVVIRSFHETGLFLHTDIGTIGVSASSASQVNQSESQIPQFRGAGISQDSKWITYNGKNLLWLPSEYRPTCSDVVGEDLSIGTGAGKVWLCSLNSRELETLGSMCEGISLLSFTSF